MHAALSPTRPISAEEQQAIVDLRTILPSIECLEDSYILRWLRAKDLRFDETAEALKKHVTFRKAWELDSIESWEAPEIRSNRLLRGINSPRLPTIHRRPAFSNNQS
ncbi:hypothetical protein ANCDUO_12715 [Ancylostoma duodenale]|uniref:CRAL/TRIO N-terminal domain-containing protein n=1 Tax=Ancylostoma duodenale TaxID=51022 RepID=A0A0C2GJ29_9BILA|nr:hypothetical protein ANCDUO_12715 [Ancylostoma duodenale]